MPGPGSNPGLALVLFTEDAFFESDGSDNGVVFSGQVVEVVVLIDGLDSLGVGLNDPLISLE